MRLLKANGARTWLSDAALVFVAVSFLIWPLYKMEYLANWASIEAVFIGQARFLMENGWTPGWQPNWYCGTRADFVYPPGLMYGTALISKWMGVSTARGYHIYTAFFYAFGLAGIYWFARAASGSRRFALWSAGVSAIASPAYLFLPEVSRDAKLAYWMPSKLNVLVRYGEGPHMSAFALLMPMLAASWWGLRRGRPGLLALSAILAAAVVSNNFYGATALALIFPILVWALWITGDDHGVIARAAAVAAVSYGLTAFWLTPSFMRITIRNLRFVAEKGNDWSLALAGGLGLVFALVTYRWAKGRPERAWPVFGTGALGLIVMNVLGNALFGFRLTGEPSRLLPEFDLALVMGGTALGMWLWNLRPRKLPVWAPRAGVAALAALVVFLSKGYLRRMWDVLPADLEPQRRIEFRVQDWVARNMPGERLFTTGTVRFWYNVWNDLPDVAGRAEQGLLNMYTNPAYYEITGENPADDAIRWLQAFGASGVIVHDAKSTEIYHDYPKPEKYKGVLPVAWDSGEGDYIYRVPRRYAARARVVSSPMPAPLGPMEAVQPDLLAAYVDWIEKGPAVEPSYIRESTDRIRVRARIGENQGLVVQDTYDPAWRAYSLRGERLQVTPDPLGMIFVHTPPGDHELLLALEPPLENLWGRVLTGLAALALAVLVLAAWRGEAPSGLTRRRWLPVSLAVLVLANVGANQFIFLPGELPYRDSIEGGYAAMARMIGAHPHPWGWNPLMYAGLPTQFLYLPGVPYFVAAAGWLTGADAFRLVTGGAACLAPLGAAALVFYFTRSRGAALGAAVAVAFLSPGYLFYEQLSNDRGLSQIPWRLQLLVKYGEGPHNFSLFLMPFALIAMWKAAAGRRLWEIAAAAMAMAAITLTNWIGAMSLAWCGLSMVAAGLGTNRITGFRLWRLLATGLLGYLLAAFWLTPSFIETTVLNWPTDAFGYKSETRQWILLAGLFAGAGLLRLAFVRARRDYFLCFLSLSAFGFGYLATVYYRFGLDTIPESRRYTMEFEFFLLILGVELLRRLFASRHFLFQQAGVVAVVAATLVFWQPVFQHARFATERLRPVPEAQTIEHRIAKFIESRQPRGRVYAPGGTRFRLNRWTDLQQLGGVFESGLHTRTPVDMAYKVMTGLGSEPGKEGEDAVKVLKIAGVEYAIVHDQGSAEHYRDVRFPNQFKGLLPAVFDTGSDTVYQVPFRGLARLVRYLELPGRIPAGSDVSHGDPLVRALDDASRPRLQSHWKTRDTLEISGRIPPDMLVSVAVNYHRGWTAKQDGRRLGVGRDAAGFITLPAEPAENSRIVLQFENVEEPKRAAAVSGVASAAAILMLLSGFRRRRNA
jgi:hypothetical protein